MEDKVDGVVQLWHTKSSDIKQSTSVFAASEDPDWSKENTDLMFIGHLCMSLNVGIALPAYSQRGKPEFSISL